MYFQENIIIFYILCGTYFFLKIQYMLTEST